MNCDEPVLEIFILRCAIYNRQASAHAECRCKARQWYPEIRL